MPALVKEVDYRFWYWSGSSRAGRKEFLIVSKYTSSKKKIFWLIYKKLLNNEMDAD